MPERDQRERQAGGVLGTMRVRKKLLVLHTAFSAVLAVILLVALRPAASEVLLRAEMDEAVLALRLTEPYQARDLQGVSFGRGTASGLGLPGDAVARAAAAGGEPVPGPVRGGMATAVRQIEPGGDDSDAVFETATASIPGARRAVRDLYVFVVLAVLGVYGLIAVSLELFVLPQTVYGPIRRILDAEHAVQTGDSRREIIDERHIPADELGEIMRSRNESVRTLRRQEVDLADALQRFERVATDLKRKNHLLEAARRNLADADRLASLGMMSAGIAHELNTPLTVAKGLAEKLARDPDDGLRVDEAQLLRRVVVRLERLGESLLDFARVRPPSRQTLGLAGLVDEAVTLVTIDRDTAGSTIVSRIDPSIELACDGDRIVQVLVNLIRNAADAVKSTSRQQPGGSRIVVAAEPIEKDGAAWVAVTVTDDGPGIDPKLMETLFDPFVTGRLDARGTGLGLAVAQGIIEEHGGVILARNRDDGRGAVIEFVLPVEPSATLSSGQEARDE
ncbi:MAG: ATP-binding protein [Planctomycetota bacterium]